MVFSSTKAVGYLSVRDFKTVTGHSSDLVTGKKGKILRVCHGLCVV